MAREIIWKILMRKVILIFLFLPSLIFCKERNTTPKYDNEFWTVFELEFPVYRSLIFNVENEFRFNHDLEDFQQNIVTIGPELKLNKYINFGAAYQFRNKVDVIENNLLVQATASFKISILDLSNRLRYHHKYLEDEETGQYLRDKLKLAFDFDKIIKPYVAVEAFYRFNYEEASRIEKGRYQLGFDLDMPDKQEVGLFYIYEHEYDVNKPLRANIIGISYKKAFK